MSPEQNNSAVQQAGEVIGDYIADEYAKAVGLVFQKQEGKGCLCHQCMSRAVHDANNWTLWTMHDEIENGFDPEMYLFSYDLKTRTIQLGPLFEEQDSFSYHDDWPHHDEGWVGE